MDAGLLYSIAFILSAFLKSDDMLFFWQNVARVAFSPQKSWRGIALQNMNIAQYDRARAEQRKLAIFQPWMTHSIYEKAPGVVFHAQLLADHATIEELSGKMFDELDRATES
jgi:hypothetical protein